MEKMLILLLIGLAASRTAPSSKTLAPTCEDEMQKGGLTPSFANSVAHRLHSLTVEDIEYYFSDAASKDNDFPTVNENLSGSPRVLPYAPVSGSDTSFLTGGLRALDHVLRNMDKDDYAITNYSTLEKVAHALHMAEMWQHSKKHYEDLTMAPPAREVCSCVLDTANNGILQELNLLALKIKYPGITSGKFDPREAPRPQDYKYSLSYSLTIIIERTKAAAQALQDFDFAGEEKDVVARAAKELVDGDAGTQMPLNSEEGWENWKEGFKNMQEVGNYELAVFMFCKLNE